MPTACRTAVCLLIVLALSSCQRTPTSEPIVIGHLATFNGPNKAIAEHAKQAILLAIEDVNREGNQVLGRRLAVLHPSYPEKEDALKPVAVRLITVDKVVALLGGADVEQAEKLGRAAQPYEVPMMTSAALPPKLLGANVFSINACLTFQGQVLARFAAKELPGDKSVVTLMDSRVKDNELLTDAFAQEMTKLGVVVAGTSFKSAAELTDQIESRILRMPKPRAICYAGTVADLVTLKAKLDAAGLKIPILVGGSGEHLAALSLDRNAGDAVYVTTYFVLGEGSSQSQEFVKKYQERFHENPDGHAALAYDGIRVLFEAMRRAKSFQPAKLLEELGKADATIFDTLSGPLAFNKTHAARRPLYVGQLENGQVRRPKLYASEDK
jgi:branched-chain amino acid transport system substrate-binding protein